MTPNNPTYELTTFAFPFSAPSPVSRYPLPGTEYLIPFLPLLPLSEEQKALTPQGEAAGSRRLEGESRDHQGEAHTSLEGQGRGEYGEGRG